MPAVIPCAFEELQEEYDALFDTGAEYSVMHREVAAELGLKPDGETCLTMSTRLGDFQGSLQRHAVRIPALAGEDLLVEPAWFVCAEWPGPMVLGWRGFLESITFGCNPRATSDEEGRFYFALLSEPAVGVDAGLRNP